MPLGIHNPLPSSLGSTYLPVMFPISPQFVRGGDFPADNGLVPQQANARRLEKSLRPSSTRDKRLAPTK